MNIINHFLLTGLLLLTTIVFGFWVSRRGRPYHNLLFNIHKLLALAGVVLTAVRIFQLTPFNASFIILAAIGAIPVIGLFATGAIMSIREEESKPVLFVHQVSLGVIIVLIVTAVVFLFGNA
jgi:hypothetical protein